MGLFRKLFKREKRDEKEIISDRIDQELIDQFQEKVETAELDEALPLATRPLPPPKPYSSSGRRILFGQASDPGQLRPNNQDACLSLLGSPEMNSAPPPIAFFVVADGMGGHHDGELASAIAAKTLSTQVIKEIVVPHINGADRTSEQKTIPEVLAEAMTAANIAVQQQVSNGGTTATCCIVRGDLAYIAHVGDSRAYLVSEESMELITRDHSLVRRLQELGQITAEEAAVHPQRNVLYRAIGQGDNIEIDSATRRLPPSSRLLLCSDGLWGLVDDEKMAEVVRAHDDPQEACEQLVDLANALGGPDNITIILVQMPD
nr:serine/threonine-protein phosphatase [Anaerolineae bacterium]